LELVAQLLLGELLDHADLPVARVVHDDVEPPEPVDVPVDGGRDGGAVGDVQRQGQHGLAVRLDQRVERPHVPRRGRDAVTALQRGLRPLAAEALGGAGDEPDRGCGVHALHPAPRRGIPPATLLHTRHAVSAWHMMTPWPSSPSPPCEWSRPWSPRAPSPRPPTCSGTPSPASRARSPPQRPQRAYPCSSAAPAASPPRPRGSGSLAAPPRRSPRSTPCPPTSRGWPTGSPGAWCSAPSRPRPGCSHPAPSRPCARGTPG